MNQKNPKDLLKELLKMLRESGIVIKCIRKTKNYLLVDGEYDPRTDVIKLFYNDRDKESEGVLAMLIHEYGHYVAQKKYGKYHTERQAWEQGESSVPKRFITKNFRLWKEFSLAGYELEDEKLELEIEKILKKLNWNKEKIENVLHC